MNATREGINGVDNTELALRAAAEYSVEVEAFALISIQRPPLKATSC